MWLSLTLQTDAVHAESLSDALMDLGALSVSVEDADAGTERETPQFGEPGYANTPLWQSSRVIALVDPDTDLQALADEAASAIGLPATAAARNCASSSECARLRKSMSLVPNTIRANLAYA